MDLGDVHGESQDFGGKRGRGEPGRWPDFGKTSL